ncbi:MAG: calcium/sodium antiporter [Phycisphaeraceae bacterium]|nr:MAG: calcium/sodium antiporter [Phycisphaeraceae bacterium]
MPKLVPVILFALTLALGAFMVIGVEDEGRVAISTAMLAVALVLLVFGADFLVHGAVVLARQLGVSAFFIGVTVVAFGTSAPELAASVGAAARAKGELAIGNVLGSNIANICLILGVTALIKPIPVDRSIWRVDAPIMLLVTVLASFSVLDYYINPAATIGRIDGVLLVLGLVAYVWYNAKAGKINPEEVEHEVEIELSGSTGETPPGARLLTKSVPALLVAFGLAGLIVGAELLVDGATTIASEIGVSDAIIGLTVVALGTSIPELVFSARAAMKDHPEIAIGNIIGSNVFNLLSVLGIAALVRPLAVPSEAAHRDIWVVMGATALCLLMMKSQRRVNRLEGAALVLGYAVYTGYLYLA